MDRALSLLHKTNQFNLSLWRPAPAELAAFVADPSSYAYGFRLVDRVGDAGIISVLLASRQPGGVRLAAWVLSCRVFSRGVEWAVAQHLASWVDGRGGAPVTAPFTAGPRNQLVAGVLSGLGFKPGATEGDVTWYAAPRLSPPRHHMRIVEK
jgi:FkbH-like protein